MVEGIDEHISLLVGCDIATNLLTEHLGIAVNIEVIILQLERQSYLLAKLIQVLCILIRSIGKDSTHLQGTSQENAGLEANHLDIFLLLHIVTVFKLHIKLLTFTNFQGSGRKEFQHLGKMLFITLSHTLISQNEHAVARKDCRIGIPFLMNRFMTATQISIVHQVIMQQSIVMISFQGNGIHQNLLRIVLEKIVAQKHERRTNTLATHRKYVSDRLIKRLWLSFVRQISQKLIYHA